MYRSKLFFRLFSMLTLVVALFSSAIYLFSVPLIKEAAYEIELNASRTILDNVFELASKIHVNLETHRKLALDWHKRQLRNILDLVTSYIGYIESRAERGEITPDEARRMIFEGLRTFKYGNSDYIWVTDYNSVLLSHPDPAFQGRDVSEILDHNGQRLLARIVDIARNQGDGWYTYPWSNPRRGEGNGEKVSYFKDFPKLGVVIGTGVYLDDIAEEVARRKEEAIRDLRQALRNIRIAKTGYVYIFDSSTRMIIHPNANIEERDFAALKNPATGRPINEELKESIGTGKPVFYMWDKPSDPNNYAYEKISWVRHFDGFDWYIASSVYVEELRRSSETLANRILFIAVAVMVLAVSLGYWAARRLVDPLNRLADTARRVRGGDLEAQSGVVRDDEIGTLATTFDDMIRRLRGNIASLDSRVQARTADLEETNRRLQDAVQAQVRAQGELAEIEGRQRLILDAIPASVAYLDRERRLRFVNRQWTTLTGQPKTTQLGRRLASVLGTAVYCPIAEQVEAAYRGADISFEHLFQPGPGESVVAKVTLIPEHGPGGRTSGLFVLAIDRTAEKETERQLMEVQRLKAVGQLAGGLAHDFNNLLSVILGNLSAAQEKFAGVAGLDTYLEPASRAGRRGADITSRLLAFARRQPLRPIAVEVCGVIRDMAVLLTRSFPASIAVIVPPDDQRCWILADPNQLENALINLAINARDAMARGGILRIDVTPREVTAPLAYDEAVAHGSYAEVRVEDTGSGFAADALPRAFEPFFTTKDHGSGLGLSMVYGFVKQSGGYIRLDSEAGVGSRVLLLLPRTEPPADPFLALPRPSPGAAIQPGALALLVEDDADVRQVVRGHLMGLGYAVLEAASAAEALDLVESVEGISLVLSDVVMPGPLNGVELARRVCGAHPAIRVVLMSGLPVDEDGHGRVPVLQKPFSRQELIETLRPMPHTLQRETPRTTDGKIGTDP